MRTGAEPVRGRAQVDVIVFALERLPGDLELLAPDERDRADRFHFTVDRDRYVAGRARLRRHLSARTGVAPDEVKLRVGPQGKPSLAEDVAVEFNLSHSGGRAVLAVSDGPMVGIDIEAGQTGIAEERIAEYFFAPAEVNHLESLDREQRDRAFLECWTRKEAYLKGKGGGLSLPLDGFEVAFGPGQNARLLSTTENPDDTNAWSLVDLTPYVPEGFVAALAVEAANDGFRWAVDGDRWRGAI
jgi:4'-phosphopantetheinyl transferase